MKSVADQELAARAVAWLRPLRSNPTAEVISELAMLSHASGDDPNQGDQRHDAYLAIMSLQKLLEERNPNSPDIAVAWDKAMVKTEAWERWLLSQRRDWPRARRRDAQPASHVSAINNTIAPSMKTIRS